MFRNQVYTKPLHKKIFSKAMSFEVFREYLRRMTGGNFTKYMILDRAQASVLAKPLVEMARLQSCDLQDVPFYLFIFLRNI